MNRLFRSLLLCLARVAGRAGPRRRARAASRAASDARGDSDEEQRDAERCGSTSRHSDNVVVNMWGEARLPANEVADGVIAIFGDAHVEGEVIDAVVTIFGNAHVTGPVHGGVVSLFGNTYIDGPVQEAAVAGLRRSRARSERARSTATSRWSRGKLTRDPQAVVQRSQRDHRRQLPRPVTACACGSRSACSTGARSPSSRASGWAWAIAFGFLLFYVVIALLFDRSVMRCVETLETQPGQSTVASIMAVMLVPVLLVLLVVSVIGIAVLPFAGMALVCATLFGKAVVLAALGRRLTRFTGIAPFSHVAFATFVGGLIALGLYVIPVIGVIAYNLLGIIGLGVVAYTILLSIRQRSRKPRGARGGSCSVQRHLHPQATRRWATRHLPSRALAATHPRATAAIAAPRAGLLDPHGRTAHRHRADQRHRQRPRHARRRSGSSRSPATAR